MNEKRSCLAKVERSVCGAQNEHPLPPLFPLLSSTNQALAVLASLAVLLAEVGHSLAVKHRLWGKIKLGAFGGQGRRDRNKAFLARALHAKNSMLEGNLKLGNFLVWINKNKDHLKAIFSFQRFRDWNDFKACKVYSRICKDFSLNTFPEKTTENVLTEKSARRETCVRMLVVDKSGAEIGDQHCFGGRIRASDRRPASCMFLQGVRSAFIVQPACFGRQSCVQFSGLLQKCGWGAATGNQSPKLAHVCLSTVETCLWVP